jgi:hypothetical protein
MPNFALNSHSIFAAALGAVSLLVACSNDDRDFTTPSAGAAGIGAAGASTGAAGKGSAGGGASGVSGGGGSAGGAGSVGGGAGGAPTTGGGAGGTPGSAGSGTAGGGAGAAAGGAASACPADATFCANFEVTTLPTGAVYKANAAPGEWTRDFEVDSTLSHLGRSSLRVKAGGEAGISGAYRMLAVPAPAGAFWVRFYIQQTELDLGDLEHNVFASAAVSDEPNAASVEFAEDVGLAFNASDAVRWPVGYGRTMSGGTMPFKLPKGMWHCIEISFDSTARQQQLFVNGTQQIDAKDFPAAVSGGFKNFKFGFNQLHGPARKIWYDDVAVAPTRIKCL